ncbi:MAG: hypothetical protein K6T80_08365 [Firmicutes bacterium]|nr:hypothetical protein [Bacillota bacterium]
MRRSIPIDLRENQPMGELGSKRVHGLQRLSERRFFVESRKMRKSWLQTEIIDNSVHGMLIVGKISVDAIKQVG